MTPASSESAVRVLEGQNLLAQANALIGQKRLEEGADLYLRAAAHVAEWHLPHLNLGIVLLQLGRDEAARKAFEDAIARKPDCWQSHLNLALLHLRHGRYADGWREYDWRFRAGGQPAPRTGRPQPVWNGKRLKGEKLLLCTEQGTGDLIQFLRFVPEVATRGARIFLECPRPLWYLLEGSAAIERLVDPTAHCPEAELQFPLLSVPRILGSGCETRPGSIPYLRTPDCERTDLDDLLDNQDSQRETMKIGVAWTGDPDNPNNAARSCSPEDFRCLSALPGVCLFSLQYQDGGCSTSRLRACGIRSLGPALGDFAEVAAIIERLDLVLTIDTVVAHIAGALGKKTWILLSRPCDWRWGTDGTTSPWYPTAHLFRESSPGSWADVFAEVAHVLSPLLPPAPH